MYAIAFDMVVETLKQTYPGASYNNAYFEIGQTLRPFGFYRVQGSLYVTEHSDLSMVFKAILALKKIPWFADSVRDIRGFKIEDWSNFTDIVKTID